MNYISEFQTNITCDSYHNCNSCTNSDVLSCSWCSTDSNCVPYSSKSNTCSTELVGTCDQTYYTIIFVVIVSAMIFLCCGACYIRHLHRVQNERFLSLLSPLLPNSRQTIFNDEKGKEWMCIICGFDNKSRNQHCSMCGTPRQFSQNYKEEKQKKKVASRNKSDIDILIKSDDFTSQLQDSSLPPIATEKEGSNFQEINESPLKREKSLTSDIFPEKKISSLSFSLSFQTNNSSVQIGGVNISNPVVPLSPEKRSEAINYRRINMLSLRQKSARRRKMWQRAYDESSNTMVWARVPINKTKVGSAPFGYTPRTSMSLRRDRSANNSKESYEDISLNSSIDHPADALMAAYKDKEERPSFINRLFGQDKSKYSKNRKPHNSRDSFGDSNFISHSPGYTSVFDENGALVWEKVESGTPITPSNYSSNAAKFPWNKSAHRSTPENQTLQPHHQSFFSSLFSSNNNINQTMYSQIDSNDLEACENDEKTEQNIPDLAAVAAYTFTEKQLWFLDRISELQRPWTDGFVKIEIRRQFILEDSHRSWSQLKPEHLHRWMRYQFHNEPGIDAGGLEREWFLLLCQEIFNPSNGFFMSNNNNGYHINPLSGVFHTNHLSYFHFFGRIFGKAIMEQQFLKANLSLPLRKQIVGMPVTFSDLEFVDEELYRNLSWLSSNLNVNELMLDFTVSYSYLEHSLTSDLLPNGTEIIVNDDNKQEYLQLRLKHRLLDSIKEQLEHLLNGLYEVIPPELLSVFDYQEFDLLLCGIPEIDIEDWKKNTEYQGEYFRYGGRHKIIKWFWQSIESMSIEERIRLLQFTTGCSRLPVQGFKALQSSDGKYRKFNIQSISKNESIYPRAHTCFNKLDLPLYESKEELDAYLSVVLNIDIVGFTME